MTSFVLELEGKRHVSIEEREGGLMVTETKLDMKRRTSKDRWIARANCPNENVQLGRLAEIEKLEGQGYVLDEDPNGAPRTGAPSEPEAILYYRGALKGLPPLRDAVRSPETIPGITFMAEADGWILMDDERAFDAGPHQDRLEVRDSGTKQPVSWTAKGSALSGVLLALAEDGHGTLAFEENGNTLTLAASDLKREIKAATGKVRASLEAMGVIEPQQRDYAAAIGGQHRALVL